MADKKFTDLPAASGIPDNGSLVAFSTYDGVSTYVSEKYTMSQLKDTVYVMEAEDKITFNSSGTNKTVISDSNSSSDLRFLGTDDEVLLSTDSGALNEAYLDLLGGANPYVEIGIPTAYMAADAADDSLRLYNYTNPRIQMNSTGIGFFNTTPVAQPTGVAVSAAGIHAALVSLGLITA
jgi:hypothetical protein